MLVKKNMIKLDKMGETYKANCWGSTQFALGVTKSPKWVEKEQMTDFLNSHTNHITGQDLEVGDIVVFTTPKGELFHTAVYKGKGLWWHKLGSLPTERSRLSTIERFYSGICEKLEGEKTVMSFRRYKG